jgi:CBS domain-containing protein
MPENRELTAGDVMSAHVVSIPPATSIESVSHVMREQSVAALPVTDESGRILGILTEADLVRRLGAMDIADPVNSKTTAADIMTTPVHTIAAGERLSSVAELFENHGIKHAPVLRDGALVGIVSQTDLVRNTLGEHRKTPESRTDESLEAEIFARLRQTYPGRDDFPDFSVCHGVVRFWGAPPAPEELEIVMQVVRATRS